MTNRAESSSEPSARRGLIAELGYRHVWRAAAVYIGAAWALAQGIAQLGPFFGAPDWLVRWFVIACIIGFPFWIAFAWFYEWTPQGLRRESKTTERDPAARRAIGRKLDIWIIGVLAVAVVLLVTNQFVLHRDATSTADRADAKTIAASLAKAPEQSVAVLPFVDESTDRNQQYFSDGLSENLIIALSQFKGLKVISRDSSFQFRGSKDSAAQIGARLGVRHLLEGSVQRLGNEVRISAMLVNAADGSALWSHHYDRPYKDLFKLQDDITHAVTTALKTRLLASNEAAKQTDRPPSGNLAAYNAVLQGRFHGQRNTLVDTQAAARYFQQAVQIDPDYAYAWAELASTRVALVTQFPAGKAEARKLQAGARAAAAKALALAPDLAAAHMAQAGILQDFDWNLAGAQRELQRAAQLASQSALLNLATLQAYRGHFTEAAKLLRRTAALDPLSASTEGNLGMALTSAGDLPAAQQALHKAIALQPQAASYRANLAITQILQGDSAAALATARQEPGPFWRTYALTLAYWAGGEHAKSDATLKQFIDKYADVAGSQIAVVYAQRGQPDQAFHWLDHAVATRDPGVLEMLTDPFLARYKNDPRYTALALKLGLIGGNDAGAPAPASTP